MPAAHARQPADCDQRGLTAEVERSRASCAVASTAASSICETRCRRLSKEDPVSSTAEWRELVREGGDDIAGVPAVPPRFGVLSRALRRLLTRLLGLTRPAASEGEVAPGAPVCGDALGGEAPRPTALSSTASADSPAASASSLSSASGAAVVGTKMARFWW